MSIWRDKVPRLLKFLLMRLRAHLSDSHEAQECLVKRSGVLNRSTADYGRSVLCKRVDDASLTQSEYLGLANGTLALRRSSLRYCRLPLPSRSKRCRI